jgi:hypothetical protein
LKIPAFCWTVEIVLHHLVLPPSVQIAIARLFAIRPCKCVCVCNVKKSSETGAEFINRRWVTSNWHFSLYSTVRPGFYFKKKRREKTGKKLYHDFQSLFIFLKDYVAWWYAVARCFTSLGLYIPVFLFFHFFSSILKKKKKKKKITQCVRIESGEVQRISRWSRWSAIFWANVWLFFKYLKREKKQEEKEKKRRGNPRAQRFMTSSRNIKKKSSSIRLVKRKYN